MQRKLTEGRPFKLLLGFMMPILAGCLLQQLYNITDSIIVGQALGVTALASVGATGSLHFLILGFCIGLCNGFAIPIAQEFGANDMDRLKSLVASLVPLCLIFSLCLTATTAILAKPLLLIMQTPKDIVDLSTTYIRILFLGIPMTILYNTTSAIIRALGDSRTPLLFLLISAVMNIFLDILLVVVIPMGVAGAAIATVIAQGFSGLICLAYMRRKYSFLLSGKKDRKLYRRLLMNGVPMGLQYSVTAIGSVILQANVNILGSSAVASITAGSRIYALFASPFDAMGSAMATYSGQNTGAGTLPRLREGLKDCSIMSAIYSLCAFAILYFLGGELASLFIAAGTDPAIIENAHLFLIIVSLFYFPLAWVNIYRFTIQGMGFSELAIISGVLEMIARIAVGVLAVPAWGFTAACFASPAAWILADSFLLPAFEACYRKLKARQAQ